MATTVILNGDIRTCDARKPHASAFAIDSDGKFLGVGPTEVIKDLYVNEQTKVIDVQGKTVVPGFVDGHTHLMHGIEQFAPNSVDLLGNDDPKDWLRQIKDVSLSLPEGGKNPWVIGGRWDASIIKPGTFPTLDEVEDVLGPNFAMCLFDIDFHSIWVNRRALELAGIDPASLVDTEEEEEEAGASKGVLHEVSQGLILESKAYIDRSTYADPSDLLQKVFRFMNSKGVTSAHEMPLESTIYEAFLNPDLPPLPIRLFCGHLIMLKITPQHDSKFWDDAKCLRDRLNAAAQEAEKKWKRGPQYRLGYAKFFADGTMTSYNAALWDDYADKKGEKGDMINEQDVLDTSVQNAFDRGFAVSIHAIGDRGVSMSLDALTKADNPFNCSKRIEHLELVRPKDLTRFVNQGVAASVQPSHCCAGSFQRPKIGKNRMPWSYAWQKLLTTGADVVLGSDWPTTVGSPLINLEDAVLRFNDGEPYDPANRLTFEEALYSHTQAGANLSGWGDEIGSISVGKWADFVILPGTVQEKDIFNNRIADWVADETWMAGTPIFVNKE